MSSGWNSLIYAKARPLARSSGEESGGESGEDADASELGSAGGEVAVRRLIKVGEKVSGARMSMYSWGNKSRC